MAGDLALVLDTDEVVCGVVVVVLSMAGNTLVELKVFPKEWQGMTVGSLKRKLQDAIACAAECQNLLLGSTVLPNSCRMSELVAEGEPRISLNFVRGRLQRIVSGHTDGVLRLWNPSHSEQPLVEFRGHTDHVLCVAVNLRMGNLVTGSRDGTIIAWASNGFPVGRMTDEGIAPSCLDVDWTNSKILSGHQDGKLRLWRFNSKAPLKSGWTHPRPVTCFAVEWPSMRAVTGTWDGQLRVWDIENCECLLKFGLFRPIACLSFDWDTLCALSGGADGTLQLSEFEGGSTHALKGHGGRLVRADADWVAHRALTASWDGSLRLWDLEQKVLLHTFGRNTKKRLGHVAVPSCVVVDWLGVRAVSGHRNGCLQLWDIGGRQEAGCLVVSVEKAPVLCLAAEWDLEAP